MATTVYAIHHRDRAVLFHADPRHEGYVGAVDEVDVENPDDDLLVVSEGARYPAISELCIGHAPGNRLVLQFFRTAADRRAAGYLAVPGFPMIWDSYQGWSQSAGPAGAELN